MITHGSLANIEKLESDLWDAADNLGANSKLTSSEYCMPVLGIIFLRHAANRFENATRQIAEDQKAGKISDRKIIAADYVKRRALFLPEEGRVPVRRPLLILGRDVENALSQEDEAGARTGVAAGDLQESVQLGEALAGAEPEVPRMRW